ncbi:MAG: tyrosine--tRNA ligase [Deltaproteobacteria bacterium]|nr:tyrosine--tRNA ligase [Deltaproteobacteria bacterium]
MSPEEQLEILKRGVVDLHVEKELLDRLRSGRPLVVKAGFDPTRPDLHLGHTVLMTKMRQFQDLGHRVVFVIGDFTATIGDPTGRNATRPPLTREAVLEGARTYAEQAFKVLDPSKTAIRYNSQWLGEMSFADVVRLAAQYPLARMMERDDFAKRWKSNQSISIHELLYPLAQGYDSVALAKDAELGACDVELGGTDQLFNLLVGRELMKAYGQKPQLVMTTPILEGIDAKVDESGRLVGAKMSKSLDNAIGVTEAPTSMFGKLMSIPDLAMWRYFELLSTKSPSELAALKAGHPRDAKVALAEEIVGRFHSPEDARAEHERWTKQFSQREVPEAISEHRITVAAGRDTVSLVHALKEAGLVPSTSEGRRLVSQGGVTLDGQKATDEKMTLARGARHTVKVGKLRWAVLVVASLVAAWLAPVAVSRAQEGADAGTPPPATTAPSLGDGPDAPSAGAPPPPATASSSGAASEPDYPAPPRTMHPTFLPLRMPRREMGATFGVSQFERADLTSVAGGFYFETTNVERRFMMRMQLPFAAVDDPMVGDIDMEFSALLWAEQDGRDGANYLSVNFDFVLPFALLNTLGGEAIEIHDRRIRKYPGVSAQSMLPIRYMQFMPHVGYARRQGPVLLYVDVGGILILACRYANYFESPTVEGVLQYGAGGAFELYASPDDAHSIAIGLELSITQFITQVAAPDNAPGVRASADDRRDRDIGMSLAPSLRARIARRFLIDLGLAFALVGDQTWTRYTPSPLWRHDWTLFTQLGLGF